MTAVALDTNLLLLAIVGRATGSIHGKRLKAYTVDDLRVLEAQLAECDRLVTTPNVWTEVSNIWDFGVRGDVRFEILRELAATIDVAVELVHPSRDVTRDPAFDRLGLTDCVWLAVLDNDTTLLTDDIALRDMALSRGLKAVNFTNLRSF